MHILYYNICIYKLHIEVIDGNGQLTVSFSSGISFSKGWSTLLWSWPKLSQCSSSSTTNTTKAPWKIRYCLIKIFIALITKYHFATVLCWVNTAHKSLLSNNLAYITYYWYKHDYYQLHGMSCDETLILSSHYFPLMSCSVLGCACMIIPHTNKKKFKSKNSLRFGIWNLIH